MKKMFLIASLLFVIALNLSAQQTNFIPGQVWNDTEGNPINAHGGGLLFHNGVYYWYGEIKKGKTIRVAYVTSWKIIVLRPPA